MAKHALPILTGGLNEVTRSDLIDSSQLQVCDNYEVVGDGVLRKRKGASEYDNGEIITLKEAIDGVFDSVIYISEPYYPPKKLTDHRQQGEEPVEMSGDFILFVFGITPSGVYQLHAFSEWTGLWDHTFSTTIGSTNNLSDMLTNAGVVYTSESDIEIFIGANSVNVVDGVNRAHSVAIDPDGIMSAGISGIPAPTNRARTERLTSWEAGMWESDPSASRLSEPGLFQCTYTVVSKTGEESNPSPLSETLNLQYFKKDIDGIEEQWIDKITVKDLSVPDVSQSILDNLKYFKIYMRVIKYSEGLGVESLELTEQFEIINKKDNNGNVLSSGSTGNDYILTVEVEPGNLASYENDVAPVAKTGAELGGITMLGNIKTKLKFPWDFQYFHNIRIANKDSKSYVDAVVRIRLWDKDATETSGVTPIENFVVDDWITEDSGLGYLNSFNLSQIRLFDQDTTTPLKVLYNGIHDNSNYNTNGTDDYIDLYVEIPYFTAGSDHTIYLCWTPGDVGSEEALVEKIADTGYDGVPDIYNVEPGTISSNPPLYWDEEAGFKYGMFFQNKYHNNLMQSVFKPRGVMSGNDLLYDDYSGINPRSYKGYNKIDGSIDIIPPSASAFDDSTFVHPILDEVIPHTKMLRISNSGTLEYDWHETGKTLHIMPTGSGGHKQTIFIRVNGGILETSGDYGITEAPIISLITNTSYYFDITLVDFAWTSGGRLHVEHDDSVVMPIAIHMNENVETGLYRDFILSVSWEYSEGASSIYFKAYNNYGAPSEPSDNTNYRYMTDRKDGGVDAVVTLDGGIREIRIGAWDPSIPDHTYVRGALSPLHIDEVRLINNFVFKEGLDGDDMFKNMANYMPAYDNMVGYKYSDTTHNNNITFGETKELLFKDYENMTKWTDVNYNSYPDLFFKRVREPILKIMGAPSFLQFEYQNTFIIFTRNSINRFVLQGSADGWSGSSSSVIEEKTQYGLLAEKSLVRSGDALFWLSEAGVMMWGKDGMGLISKNMVDIPISDNYIGFYAPLNNQYILTDPVPGDLITFTIQANSPNSQGPVIFMDGSLDVTNEGRSAVTVYQFTQPDQGTFNEWGDVNPDGIEVGMYMRITGTGQNDGDYLVDSFNDSQVYIDVSGSFTSQTLYGGHIKFEFWNNLSSGYVYHIDKNIWTKFQGSEMNGIIKASTLTGGNRLDNVNLLLYSDGNLKQYPGNNDAYTNDNAIIKTKDMFFERGVLRRVKLGYNSEADVDLKTNVTKNKADGTEVIKTNPIYSIENGKWRGIANGNSRGKSVNFEVEGADEIESILYDIKVESGITQ